MKKLKKRLIAAGLVIIIAISTFFGYLAFNSNDVYAARGIDQNRTLSFEAFSRVYGIPETTIFIGTHLIKLECATDELWEQAVKSQENSGQNNIYYKSELAGGTWYEITNAESLADINGSGTPVKESELSELRVMFYTFEYGKTYWATNRQRHCIFDGDYDYWDLYHLDEMQSVYDQWAMLQDRGSDSNEMDKLYRQYLNDLLRLTLRNTTTDLATLSLHALQDIYDSLVDEDRIDDADIIYKLMAKLDNERRAEIFKILAVDDGRNGDWIYPDLDKDYRSILDESLQKCAGDGFDEDDEDFLFIVDSSIIDALGTAIRECTIAYNEKSSNMLRENGSREIDGLIYNTSQSIIDAGFEIARQNLWSSSIYLAELTPEIDADITRLGHLMNIEDGKIVNNDEELEIIDNELMGPVAAKFQNAAMAGPNEDYVTAKNSGVSDSALSGMLGMQESEVDFIRLELQDVITAKVDRMEVEDAIAFVYDRINQTEGMKANVPDTDFAPNGTAEIQRHIDWLTKLLAKLYEQYGSGNSELDNLNAEADNLLEKQQQALDENDYRRAKEFEEARNVVIGKIDDMTGQLTDKINDPNTDAGEKALAKAILDGGHDGMDKLLQSIVDDALNKQNNGEDISDAIDLLSELGYTDGLDQLGVTGDTGDDGMGGTGRGLTADEILALLVSLEGEIDRLSRTRLPEAIRAMEILYDMGYENAGTVAARLANIAFTKGNKHLYSQINDSGPTEFVDIATLSWVAKYRYAYDNAKRTGTLIGTGIKTTYQFAAGDKAIYEAINKDTVNPKFKEFTQMSSNVRLYKDSIYAPVEVAEEHYMSLACHIKKSKYGLCITSRMEGEAQRLVEALLPLMEGAN